MLKPLSLANLSNTGAIFLMTRGGFRFFAVVVGLCAFSRLAECQCFLVDFFDDSGARIVSHFCALAFCSMTFAGVPAGIRIRRGVPKKVARDIPDHKTNAVFSRYNIVSEADMRDTARKIEAGAKTVIHSSFIVAPESSNSEKKENARKPS